MPTPSLIQPIVNLARNLQELDALVKQHTNREDYSEQLLACEILSTRRLGWIGNIAKNLASPDAVKTMVKANIALLGDGFTQGYSEDSIIAWNTYNYYAQLFDFLQKTAFVHYHQYEGEDREHAIVALNEALQYLEKMLAMLLAADKNKKNTAAYNQSVAIRKIIGDETSEVMELIETNFFAAFSSLNSFLTNAYDAIEDLEQPYSLYHHHFQEQMLIGIIKDTAYSVALVSDIEDTGLELSSAFQKTCIDLLSIRADALRNLGLYLYHQKNEQALQCLSDASRLYEKILKLDNKQTVAHENYRICNNYLPNASADLHVAATILDEFIEEASKRKHEKHAEKRHSPEADGLDTMMISPAQRSNPPPFKRRHTDSGSTLFSPAGNNPLPKPAAQPKR